MREPPPTNKKIGKRTYTLKELAQRDFVVIPQQTIKETAPKFCLASIQEDFLGDNLHPEQAEEIRAKSIEKRIIDADVDQQNSKVSPSTSSFTLPIELLNHLIEKEISQTAQFLGIETAELQAWINLQVMAPSQTLLALLRLARGNNLDPLKEEVAFAVYDACHWQAYITVEGYSKILNNHPAFDGITFCQSPENTNGIPIWMECTIYRKDRSWPIVVREYFEEVKGEQSIWQKMPRRMLRHRVMQQCARLAVG